MLIAGDSHLRGKYGLPDHLSKLGIDLTVDESFSSYGLRFHELTQFKKAFSLGNLNVKSFFKQKGSVKITKTP